MSYNGNGGSTPSSQASKRTGVAWSKSGGGTVSGNTFTFGTSNATITATYTGVSSVTLPSTSRAATKYCTYSFNGWYNPSGTYVGTTNSTYTPSATTTLTARWTTVYKTAVLDHGFTNWLNVHSTSDPNSSVVGYVGKNVTVTVYNYNASTGYYYIQNVYDSYHGGNVTGWIWEGALTFK